MNQIGAIIIRPTKRRDPAATPTDAVPSKNRGIETLGIISTRLVLVLSRTEARRKFLELSVVTDEYVK